MIKQAVWAAVILICAVFIFTGITPEYRSDVVSTVHSSNNIDNGQSASSTRSVGHDSSDLSSAGRERGAGQTLATEGGSAADAGRIAASERDALPRPASTRQDAQDSEGFDSLPQPGSASVSAFKLPEENSLPPPAHQPAESSRQDERSNSRAEKPLVRSDDKEPEEQPADERDDDEDDTDEADEGLITNIGIQGRVLTNEGKTISGVPLELTLTRAEAADKAAFGRATRQASSDGAGAYAFANLVKGDYRICTAESSSFERACISAHAPASTADLMMRVVSGSRIVGKVVDEDGTPLEDVSVVGSQQRGSVRTDKEGKYAMDLSVTPNRNYMFYFRKSGFERVQVPVKAEDLTGEFQRDVTMFKLSGVTVNMQVRDESGLIPPSGQRFRLFSKKKPSSSSLSCNSNETGLCSIRNVKPSDDYTLSVKPKGPFRYQNSVSQPINISAGSSPTIEVVMNKTFEGSVSLIVENTQGFPQPGINLALSSGSQTVGNGTTDGSGSITFDNVPAGKIRVYSQSDPRHSLSGLSITEENPQISHQKMIVDIGTLGQTITISDLSGPVGGAKVNLSWKKTVDGVTSSTRWTRYKTSREDNGEVAFGDLGEGEHTLVIQKPGYRAVRRTVNIGVDPNPLSITLEPIGG